MIASYLPAPLSPSPPSLKKSLPPLPLQTNPPPPNVCNITCTSTVQPPTTLHSAIEPHMAGAKLKYRHLGRDSAHRVSLLRNLVTSLLEHESILTTYPKAKEAQRVADHCITLAKRGTEAARKSVMANVFVRIYIYI